MYPFVVVVVFVDDGDFFFLWFTVALFCFSTFDRFHSIALYNLMMMMMMMIIIDYTLTWYLK